MFTLIGQPGDTRDESLADAAWEAVSAAILADEASAAEWLERITGAGG